MIKILYILEATSGGTQKHVVDIAKGIDKSEFQIDIIYSIFRNKHFIEESNGIFNKMYGLPIKRSAAFSDIRNILKIRSIIKQNKYDIVHCHSTKAGFVGRIAAFLSNHKNIIYSPHGFMFCDTRIRMRRLLYLYLEKFLGNVTNKLIAVSGSERDLALQHNIVPSKKIVTLYNSIDPLDFNDYHYKNRLPDKLFKDKSDIIIGTVGRLYYQKDPLTLIRSFKIVNDKYPNTKLIMVGDGPLQNQCVKLINKLDLQEKIYLAGTQKISKDFYKLFDIFVLSSHYEGLPYALLEAMMMGIPSIGTDVIGIRDLIVNGETGYLVPEGNFSELANSIIQMLDNPESLSAFSTNSRQRAEVNFNFVQGIQEYENFYAVQHLKPV